MTDVVLVFPPLVERNFGSIYPSTAVLAAYLQARDRQVVQLDCNRLFLEHMLSERELTASLGGAYQRSRPLTRAAASWVLRHLREGGLKRAEFMRTESAHWAPLDNILHLLALPYTVDPDRLVLDGTTADESLLCSYRRFFDAWIARLPISGSERFVLGISVPMGPQLLPALLLAAAVRCALGEGPRIVLGGPALSLLGEPDLAQMIDANPAVDCVVRFDGERPLEALVRQVRAGEWEPGRIPGTSSRHGGSVLHTPPGSGPELNALPTPVYTGDMIAGAPQTTLGVTQARGCYWGKCDYCDFVEVYKGSPRVRARCPERMLEDIRGLVHSTGLRRYRLITDSIPPAVARSFASQVRDSGLAISWSSFAMVDERFDAGLLELMASSGCDHLVVGLESMVTRALRKVHKFADREENLRFLRDANKAGIKLTINLIPDLPTTTREEALRGLEDLATVIDCIDRISVFGFEATRSSRVGRAPGEFGLIPVVEVSRAGQAQLALNSLPVEDPAMSSAERREVFRAYRALANRVNGSQRPQALEGSGRSYLEPLASDAHEGPVLVDFATMQRIEFPPPARFG